MSWDAMLTVQSVSGDTLYASTGTGLDGSNVTGTNDDVDVKHVGVTITYADKVPDHLQVGATFKAHADC